MENNKHEIKKLNNNIENNEEINNFKNNRNFENSINIEIISILKKNNNNTEYNENNQNYYKVSKNKALFYYFSKFNIVI